MACTVPRTLMRTPSGFVTWSTIFWTAWATPPKSSRFGRDVDIDGRAAIGSDRSRWAPVVLDVGDHVEACGIGLARTAQGNALEIGMDFDRPFRILNGQQVIVARFRINPIARRDHAVGGERADDVVDDFLLGRPSSLARTRSMLSANGGRGDVLRNHHVAHAGQASDCGRRCFGRWHESRSMSDPLTCTSIGAGRPRLSTASTKPPD